VGRACFGVGIVSWLMIGSLTINRLIFVRRLPPDLLPLMAIEMALPAVGGNAYFACTAKSRFLPAVDIVAGVREPSGPRAADMETMR
jgi:tellurite resistance protein TehA-like permease